MTGYFTAKPQLENHRATLLPCLQCLSLIIQPSDFKCVTYGNQVSHELGSAWGIEACDRAAESPCGSRVVVWQWRSHSCFN